MSTVNVLVVDDHAAHGEGLAELLSLRGFSTSHVLDGETALDQLKKGGVDVVLSDVHLTGIDGFELCRQIRTAKRYDKISFIYHTASDQLPGKDHKGDAFLIYPIETDQLVSVIQGCVVRRSGMM